MEKQNLLALADFRNRFRNSPGERIDEDEAGVRLFEIAAACRRAGIDPESALRRYTKTLIKRIENAESSE
jgi:PAS domain-containing protein